MKKFFILVRKEVRELMTPQVLLPLVLIVIVFVFVGKLVGREAQKVQAPRPVAVLDLDRSALSAKVVGVLGKSNFDVDLQTEGTVAAVIAQAKSKNERLVVVIPAGFGEGVAKLEPQKLETYTVLKNFSYTGSRDSAILSVALAAVNETLSNKLLQNQPGGADPQNLKNPVKSRDFVIIGDRQAEVNPNVVLAFISSQTTFIPIILFFVIVFSSQLIAASIATEKENKTLETLLSLPVTRKSIVAAKLVGAGFVALLTAVLYLYGMQSYLSGLTGSFGGGAGTDQAAHAAITQLGLIFRPLDYLLLGLTLFFGILAALSIALILGSFAEDAKSAQGIIAPLMVLILIPYFLVLFLDLSTLSPALKVLVYAIPFSYPFLAAPNLLLRQYGEIAWGIGYLALLFVVFVYIASKIFASDRILTMKLNFFKKNRPGRWRMFS